VERKKLATPILAIISLLALSIFISAIDGLARDPKRTSEWGDISVFSNAQGVYLETQEDLTNSDYTLQGNLPEGIRIINETIQIDGSIIDSYRHRVCSIVWDARIFCWDVSESPPIIQEINVNLGEDGNGGFTSISVGFEHSCAVYLGGGEGDVFCWGSNSFGQSGEGSENISGFAVINPNLNWEKVSAGGFHNCGIANQKAYCWGNGELGQIGEGRMSSIEPVEIPIPSDGKILEIGSGSFHSCLLTSMDEVFCWGWNSFGQLGIGDYQNSNSPLLVELPALGKISDLRVGETHNCVQYYSDEIYCWGDNKNNQIVESDIDAYPLPIEIFQNNLKIGLLDLGSSTTCVSDEGEVICFGRSFKGMEILADSSIIDITVSEEIYCIIELEERMDCSRISGIIGEEFPVSARNAKIPTTIERGTIVGKPTEEGYFENILEIEGKRQIEIRIFIDFDLDSDFDTWSDSDEGICESNPSDFLSVPDDFDGDGICDILDLDDDGDGYEDSLDIFPMDPSEWRDDDNDGIGRNSDSFEFTVPIIGAIITISTLFILLIFEYKSKNRGSILDDNSSGWAPISMGIAFYNSLPLSLQSIIGFMLSWVPLGYRGHGSVFELVEEINVGRTSERLKEIQIVSLKKILSHAERNVPHYRHSFSTIGVLSDDIRDISDLKLLPIITKQEIRNKSESFKAQNWRLFSPGKVRTSGSTGEPLEFLVDQKTRIAEYASEWRCLINNGATIGGKTASFRGNHYREHQKIGAHWYFHALSGDLHFNTFAMTPENCKVYIGRLKKYGPEIYRGYPTSLRELAEQVDEGKLSPGSVAFCSSEMMSGETSQIISEKICDVVIDWYSQSEYVVSAGTCRNGNMHINSEFGILEVVDEDGDPVPEGEVGRLIGTSLTNFSQPFIRYDLDDLGSIISSECDCGNPSPILQKIHGRMSDIIETPDGRNLSTVQVQHWWKHQAVKEWKLDIFEWVQLVQTEEGIKFRFVIKSGISIEKHRESVEGAISDLWGCNVRILFEQLEETPHGEKWRFSTSEL